MSLEFKKTSSWIVLNINLMYSTKMNLAQRILFSIFVVGLLGLNCAFAQSSGSNQPSGHGISLNFGPLLLKNVPASNEILSSSALRYDYPLSNSNFIEGGFLISNSAGAHYQNLGAGFRADFPFEDLTLYGLGGLDLVRLKGPGQSWTYYGSLHLGVGLLAHIAHQNFLRMEMRFINHPGTILLFGFGLESHF